MEKQGCRGSGFGVQAVPQVNQKRPLQATLNILQGRNPGKAKRDSRMDQGSEGVTLLRKVR